MTRIALGDQERPLIVGAVVVRAFARREPVEQLFAMEESLHLLAQVDLSLEPKSKAGAHSARPAITADQIPARYRFFLAVQISDPGHDLVVVLIE